MNVQRTYKNKLRCAIISFIFTAFSFAIFYLLLSDGNIDIRDYRMESVVTGKYGMADYHIVYSNVLLGYIFEWLYSVCDGIQWWIVAQVSLTCIAMFIVTYIIIRYVSSKTIYILAFLINMILGIQLFTCIQYESTAIILVIAGVILSYVSIKEEKYNVPGFIGGMIFILLSSLYSFSVSLIVGFFYCICLIIDVISKIYKKTEGKKYILRHLSLLIPLAISIILFVLSNITYNDDNEWKEWSQSYNTYETLKSKKEKGLLTYEDANEILGWGQNTWQMFTLGFIDDTEVFNLDDLKKLDIKTDRETSRLSKLSFGDFVNELVRSSFGIIAIVLSLFIYMKYNKKDLIILFINVFLVIAALIFSCFIPRELYVISINNVILAGLVMNLLLLIVDRNNNCKEFNYKGATNIIAVFVAGMILCVYVYIQKSTIISEYDTAEICQMINNMEMDSDCTFFLCDYNIESVLASKNITVPSNVRILGGGLGKLPISCIDDSNDFTQILVESPDAYLITTNIYMPFIYYNFYNENDKCVEVWCDKNIGDYQFIKFFYNRNES